VNKAITDSGPPLHLNEIGYIQFLKIFDTLLVSTQVKEELQDLCIWHYLTKEKAVHLQEETIIDDEITKEQDRWKNFTLHRADLSVLVLVQRKAGTLALTDDLALRRAIESLGRVFVGSLGIVIRGYREKRLSKDELHKCVDLLFNDSSLYLSRIFRDRVQKLIEELEEA
jgi:predicted nucleic acid-binding protein